MATHTGLSSKGGICVDVQLLLVRGITKLKPMVCSRGQIASDMFGEVQNLLRIFCDQRGKFGDGEG